MLGRWPPSLDPWGTLGFDIREIRLIRIHTNLARVDLKDRTHKKHRNISSNQMVNREDHKNIFAFEIFITKIFWPLKYFPQKYFCLLNIYHKNILAFEIFSIKIFLSLKYLALKILLAKNNMFKIVLNNSSNLIDKL